MKVVINRRYGGFGLSARAVEMLAGCPHVKLIPAAEYFGAEGEELEEKIKEYAEHRFVDIPIIDRVVYSDDHGDSSARNCEKLIAVVQALEKQANGEFAGLEIIEIPDDVKWHVEDYDGVETIHEDHRSWP